MRFCFACAVLAFCLYGTASTAAPLYFAMVCLRPSNPSPSPGPDPSPGPSPGPGPEQVFLGLSIGGMAAISSLAAQVVAPPVVGEAQGVLTAMKALAQGCALRLSLTLLSLTLLTLTLAANPDPDPNLNPDPTRRRSPRAAP